MLARSHKYCLNYHGFLLSLPSILHNTPYITEKRTKKEWQRPESCYLQPLQRGRCYFFLARKYKL